MNKVLSTHREYMNINSFLRDFIIYSFFKSGKDIFQSFIEDFGPFTINFRHSFL